MGCDIHLHAEVKLNGKWEHWSQPDVDRWYALFEKMAGVRGDEAKAIAPPRGLPPDITAITALCAERWGENGHSHSWLSAEEIEHEIYPFFEQYGGEGFGKWPESQFGYLFGNGWDMETAREGGLEDFRFVFWFDN